MDKEILISIDDIQPYLRIINLLQCPSGLTTGTRRLYYHYFLYVHNGKGIISLDDASFSACPGDLYYCLPGTRNSITADADEPFLLSGIAFDFTQNHRNSKLAYPIQEALFVPDHIPEIVRFNDFTGFPCHMQLHDDGRIRELIYGMIHQFNSQEKYWQNYANALLHAFIIAVIRRAASDRPGVKSCGGAGDVMRFIYENYTQDLTNASVARIFHYNPDYLSRIVYSYTGITLKQYVISLRIQASINLLLTTSKPVKEIALHVGYGNPQYFSRIFKMKTGFAPDDYRICHADYVT